MARHLLLWLLIASSGCALALDGPKPNRPRGYAPKCDDSKGLVVADGLLATAVGIGALAAFGDQETEAGVVLGLIGVAFTASAIRGNGVVNECRAEQALFAQEGGPQFTPSDDEPAVRTGRPATTSTRAVPRAPDAPADPYADAGDTRAVDPPAPARPTPPARPSAPAAQKPTKPVATQPAEIDPDAWRDFWTEVP